MMKFFNKSIKVCLVVLLIPVLWAGCREEPVRVETPKPQGAEEIDPVALSNEFNTEGENLLQEKKYKEAMEAFDKAIDINRENHLAYYNRARSALLFPASNYEGACPVNLFPAVYDLEKAFALRPEYKEEIINDPDLVRFRDTFYYSRLAGFDKTDTKELTRLLIFTSWHAASEDEDTWTTLEFTEERKFSYLYNTTEVVDQTTGQYKVVKIELKGEFTVNENKVQLVFKNKEGKTEIFHGALTQRGFLLEHEGRPGLFEDRCEGA